MKKGILVYDFKGITNEKDINIGDYIQSLAAINLISSEMNLESFTYMNRENLSDIHNWNDNIEKEEFKILMNGWYSHNQYFFPINSKAIPLFTSVHLNEKFELDSKAIDFFKQFQPIGCRDSFTKNRLDKVGIKSYLSRCLTLTFDKVERTRKGITFVLDTIPGFMPKYTYETISQWSGFKYIEKLLLNKFTIDDIKNATYLNQRSDLNIGINDQFTIASDWLEILESSELVVSSRVHSLMPAMAKGTPAIYIMFDNKDSRYSGLMEYWNYIDYTNFESTGKVEYKLNIDNGELKNDDSFREDMKGEINKIKEWLKM